MERDHARWNELAWAQMLAGEPDIAVEYARRAHELSRRNPYYLNTLGVAHAEAGDLELARKSFMKALKLKPDCVDALVNLAKVLEKCDDLPGAFKAYKHAYALAPGFPKLAVTLARIHQQLGRPDEAKSLLQGSKGVDPQDLAMALAQCDFELDGPSAAIERLRAAVAEHPDWDLARSTLAHLLLATGHWREGWRFYRPQPGSISGNPVLLRGEQGIGDVLFFLRFAPALRERGVRLALACEKKLHPIITPGPVVEEIREETGEGLPIGDLPLLLGSEDTPPAWPLAAPEKANLARFGPAPYIGCTWRAGTDVARRREFGQDPSALTKAIAPALIGGALRGWPGTVIVLQRVVRPGEMGEFATAFKGRFHDLSSLGDDLPALLAVLAALDHYVGVSNANMHFLAGLGKTARVLIPYPGEWRWMLGPRPSPWFPGFSVYRQPQSRDWTAPLAQLRLELFR